MGPEDQVIVLGGDFPETEPPLRRRWPVVAVLIAVALGVLAVLGTGAPEEATSSTGGLTAPPEPPRAFVVDTPTTLPADVHELTTGWDVIELAGGGSASDLAHGEGGWLAVSDAGVFIAHTSTNGVLWEARTIPELSGFGARAVVGDGVMAVVTSSGGWPDTPETAISVDGGATWVVTPLDRRSAVVDDVVDVAGTVHAFGAVASGGLDASRPAVWWWGGSGWSVAEGASTGGLVTAVVDSGEGTALALGLDRGEPAAWVVTEGGLMQTRVEAPAISEAAVAPDGGFVGLGMASSGGPTIGVFRSENGLTWVMSSPAESLVGLTAVDDGEPVAIGGPEPTLVVLEGDDATSIPIVGRRDGVRLDGVTAVAAFGDLLVGTGRGPGGGAALAVRGLATSPVSLPAPSDFRWRVVAQVDTTWLGRKVEPEVIGGCGAPLLRLEGGTWRLDEEVAATGAAGDPAPIAGCSPAGPWVEGEDGLMVLGEAGWQPLGRPPLDQVAALGVVGDDLVVMGYGPGGVLEAYRRSSGGDWERRGGSPGVQGPLALKTGFVAQRVDTGLPTTVVSEDGVRWTPVEGSLAGSQALPYLVSPNDPATVTLLDRWPAIDVVELPVAAVTNLARFEDGLIAQSPGSVWVRAGGDWQRIPAGVENGVEPVSVLVPADPPLLAVRRGDAVALLSPSR